MAKKRVLIFIDWFLPGDKAGGPVRSVANLIAHLGNEFEFSVITRNTDYTESQPYSEVRSDSWNESDYGARVYYISEQHLSKPTIARLLRETEYDHVYLNGMWSQPFTRWPLEYLAKHHRNLPVTIAVRGMLAPSALAIKWFKKKAFLTLAKWKKLYAAASFHATTNQEADQVRAAFGKQVEVHVAGNLPRKFTGERLAHPKKEPGYVRLINIARLAPEKNTLYTIESLSGVRSNVELNIWGARYDHEYVVACEQAAKKLPANVKVNFHGPLKTEIIHETIAQSDLMLLPTRGENFGHVILESMQAGTPVLISDQTPWKELVNTKSGWELPLKDPGAFAKVIDQVAAMNETELEEWRRGAEKMAEQYSNDEKLVALNRALFA
jgi:glycosyltransferase involved in cell wall biosynthesis